jgi:hypothetical protein
MERKLGDGSGTAPAGPDQAQRPATDPLFGSAMGDTMALRVAGCPHEFR